MVLTVNTGFFKTNKKQKSVRGTREKGEAKKIPKGKDKVGAAAEQLRRWSRCKHTRNETTKGGIDSRQIITP